MWPSRCLSSPSAVVLCSSCILVPVLGTKDPFLPAATGFHWCGLLSPCVVGFCLDNRKEASG